MLDIVPISVSAEYAAQDEKSGDRATDHQNESDLTHE
jgi:hypothetical protein